MKSSLLCLLATTTTVVHGAVCAAEATTCNGVCLDNADYTPNEEYRAADEEKGTLAFSCKAAVHGSKFTDQAQCTGPVPDSNPPVTWSAFTNAHGAKCCGTSKKSACWVDIAAGVCKNKADWTPDAPFSDTATCSGWAASIGFTATAQCTGTSAYGPWASITAMAAQKCCGTSTKSACWVEPPDFSASVCKDPADWTPDAVPSSWGGPTCSAAAAYYGLTATAQCGPDPGTKEPNTCEVNKGANKDCAKDSSKESKAACDAASKDGANDCKFEAGEDTKGFTKITTYVASECCGSGKKSACDGCKEAQDIVMKDSVTVAEVSTKSNCLDVDLKEETTKKGPGSCAVCKDAVLKYYGSCFKANDFSRKAIAALNAACPAAAAPSPGPLSEGAGHHAGITVAVSILLAVTCFVWSM